MKDYKTIAGEGFAETIEKKSRFIAHVYPVSTENEAIERINQVRGMYPDATHHVYAYICRDNNACRYSDDREPSGTAGLPVLDVLRHEELTDVCVVVVRYFGGTLLGTGGLVRAYSGSAKAGVENAGAVAMVFSEFYSVTVDYSLLGKIQYVIAENNYTLLDTAFEENVTLTVSVEAGRAAQMISAITEASLGKAEIIKTDTGYAPEKC